MEVKDARLFRMVHIQNLANVLKQGMLARNHPLADDNYVKIGHPKLMDDRKDWPIRFPNAYTLGDYVPFYFAGQTPMLLMIKNGTPPISRQNQEDIIFIVCRAQAIAATGLPFLISDRHAKKSTAKFYDTLEGLNELDWDSIRRTVWKNTEDKMDRMDLKQAEFLVKHAVPVELIAGIIVKTEAVKAEVEKIISSLGLSLTVHVDSHCDYYY